MPAQSLDILSISVRDSLQCKAFYLCRGINTLEQYGAAAPRQNVIDLSQVFPYTKSAFTYNPADGMYYKSIHGKAQTDGLNGESSSNLPT